MRERIEKRIEQLQQEKDEMRATVLLRDRELDGAIQALRDVLTAIDNEVPTATAVPPRCDHLDAVYDVKFDEYICPCGARKGAGMGTAWKKELAHVGS